MGNSVKNFAGDAAKVVVLSTVFGVAGTLVYHSYFSSENDITPPKSGPSYRCAYIDDQGVQAKNVPADNPSVRKLEALYQETSLSITGANLMQGIKRDKIPLCYWDALAEGEGNGFVAMGKYRKRRDRESGALIKDIVLNPDPRFQDGLAMILVHEARHKDTADRVNWLDRAAFFNSRESDIITLGWLDEADARAVSIAAAYELEKYGRPQHMQALRTLNGYSHMVYAFEDSISKSPDDVPQAIRAAIFAFGNDQNLENQYKTEAINLLDLNGYSHDPSKGFYDALSDNVLMAFGHTGYYDNYMNEELMEFVRSRVTMDDYRELRRQMQEQQGQRARGTNVPTAPAPVPTS